MACGVIRPHWVNNDLWIWMRLSFENLMADGFNYILIGKSLMKQVQYWDCLYVNFNSLWPSGAIWQHWSESILAHVMAWCLTAPSHHWNKCWLVINGLNGIPLRAISWEILVISICKMSVKIALENNCRISQGTISWIYFMDCYSWIMLKTVKLVKSNWNITLSLKTGYVSRLKNSCINLVAQNATLTHWGRVTHICIRKLTLIGPDNGLSPIQRQATIWTNAGILIIGPLGTNFCEIWVKIQ